MRLLNVVHVQMFVVAVECALSAAQFSVEAFLTAYIRT